MSSLVTGRCARSAGRSLGPGSTRGPRGRRRRPWLRQPRPSLRQALGMPRDRVRDVRLLQAATSSSLRSAARRPARPRGGRAWSRRRSARSRPGRCSSHASATCAGGTPRSAATSPAGRRRRSRRRCTACPGTRPSSTGWSGALPPWCGCRRAAARQRAPRDHADALVDALRDHLPLLLAVDEVVVVLHRDEPGPP